MLSQELAEELHGLRQMVKFLLHWERKLDVKADVAVRRLGRRRPEDGPGGARSQKLLAWRTEPSEDGERLHVKLTVLSPQWRTLQDCTCMCQSPSEIDPQRTGGVPLPKFCQTGEDTESAVRQLKSPPVSFELRRVHEAFPVVLPKYVWRYPR